MTSDARSAAIVGLNNEDRQGVLNVVADLEHKIYVLEQQLAASRQLVVDTESGKREAERLLNEEATRADKMAELLQGLQHLLYAGRQAEVARRALTWIERERKSLALLSA